MFFTQINRIMSQAVDITLVIRKKEGQLTVSAMPKTNGLKDEAQNHIVPLTVTGTPEELDRGFLPTICTPMQKAAGLLANMSNFEQQADKAAANSKAAKELKEKEAKDAKERKEKFEMLMKTAAELESGRKYGEALTNLKQARTFAIPQALKSVDEKINAVRMKMNQGSLFDMEAQQQVQEQQPQRQPVVQPIQVPQPVRQPIRQQVDRQPAYNNGQQANGHMNGNYPPGNNGQPVYYRQPAYSGNPYNGQVMPEELGETEPAYAVNADFSTHREGEYDQYPDFPGYPGHNMYNPQNG
ncbi:PRTRC system protein E [Dysgonomonas sp. GY75]|uniref:PRTRC system protein E n=1 Tax=Dysgonomonas sp. GY75 TaxID=2780419 RepID=UPI001883867E|nr:PRTRC system protein E [Dysgonomonas sp. GY75]MBF0648191.1 PRTRC system protein E [Dysgonomonas sp. GY75]